MAGSFGEGGILAQPLPAVGYTMADLHPVAMASVTPNLLYVRPDVKAASQADPLALARAQPLSYASLGNGTSTHPGAKWLFRALAKVDIAHVPFQPSAANTRMVSGHVPIASTSRLPAMPFAKGGKVRPLAVMSLKRSPALPDVPTVAELGYSDFEANTWFAGSRRPGHRRPCWSKRTPSSTRRWVQGGNRPLRRVVARSPADGPRHLAPLRRLRDRHVGQAGEGHRHQPE